ncbi:MAG: hypothetical protein K8T25_04830 [Planctomycetia bacterium]|nr:hypothetical protein [Planctomycetia bacterium]
METSLHRELKLLYAGDEGQLEVRLGRYRIDAIAGTWLVEIQHGSLSAIRDKVRKLLAKHHVLVVKPLVANKLIVHRGREGGKVLRRRRSPKREQFLDLFHELVYFTRVFPHPRLALELLLVEVEEWRHPGHGRRRRWRKNDCVVEDQKLMSVGKSVRIATRSDLWQLVSIGLPSPFHTGHLAEALGIDRWVAQRIAYCLRKTGTVREVGKLRNARLYEYTGDEAAAA